MNRRINTLFLALTFGLLLMIGAGCGSEEGEGTFGSATEAATPEVPAQPAPAPAQIQAQAPAPLPIIEEAPAAFVPDPEPAPESLRWAYVDTTAINIRSGPGASASRMGSLVQGDAVQILETRDVSGRDWWKVRSEDDQYVGWVFGGLMREGKPPARQIEDIDYGERKTPTLDSPKSYDGKTLQYVGVSVCQDCHEDVHREGGTQKPAFETWSKQLHASAYSSLHRDYTQQIAEKLRGIENPATDWRCLKCHVAAYGAAPEQLAPTYSQNDGVSCEVCHGPGSAYAAHAESGDGKAHGDTPEQKAALGLRKLSDLTERENVCRSCHNKKSPTYKPFSITKFSNVIRHWEDAGFVASDLREEYVTPTTPSTTPSTPAPVPQTGLTDSQTTPTVPSLPVVPPAPEAPAPPPTPIPAPVEPAPTPTPTPAPAPAEPVVPAPAPKPAPKAVSGDEEKWRKNAGMTNYDAGAGLLVLNRPNTPGGYAGIPHGLGTKKGVVEFDHEAHSVPDLIDGVVMNCQTCHHRDRPGEKPRRCFECHAKNGGNQNGALPDETKSKSRATHSKAPKHGFPKTPEWTSVEQVSCTSCHRSQDVDATSCSDCHAE